MNGGLQNIDNVVRTEPKAEKKPEQQKELKDTKSEEALASNSDRVLLSWSGKNFDYKEKGFRWFLAMGLIVAAIVAYLVWQKDWFTIVITVIVTAILIWYVQTVRPKDQDYAITTFGINISGRYYPYAEIHSFWMVYSPKIQKLYFTQTKKYLPTVAMDISTVSPERVRMILGRKIPEEARGENVLDRLVRILGL